MIVEADVTETAASLPVGCVVLAAGAGTRFGGNKLSAEYRGRSLLSRALEAVPLEEVHAAALVTGDPDAKKLSKEMGFRCVFNDRPELGLSLSVRLGTEALGPVCRGIVYFVADQPLLRRETVGALISLWRRHPDRIVAAAHNGVRGNPCLFPAEFFPELCALEGDVGGGAVIRRHPDRLLLLEVPAEELMDADTPEALDNLP